MEAWVLRDLSGYFQDQDSINKRWASKYLNRITQNQDDKIQQEIEQRLTEEGYSVQAVMVLENEVWVYQTTQRSE